MIVMLGTSGVERIPGERRWEDFFQQQPLILPSLPRVVPSNNLFGELRLPLICETISGKHEAARY